MRLRSKKLGGERLFSPSNAVDGLNFFFLDLCVLIVFYGLTDDDIRPKLYFFSRIFFVITLTYGKSFPSSSITEVRNVVLFISLGLSSFYFLIFSTSSSSTKIPFFFCSRIFISFSSSILSLSFMLFLSITISFKLFFSFNRWC